MAPPSLLHQKKSKIQKFNLPIVRKFQKRFPNRFGLSSRRKWPKNDKEADRWRHRASSIQKNSKFNEPIVWKLQRDSPIDWIQFPSSDRALERPWRPIQPPTRILFSFFFFNFVALRWSIRRAPEAIRGFRVVCCCCKCFELAGCKHATDLLFHWRELHW